MLDTIVAFLKTNVFHPQSDNVRPLRTGIVPDPSGDSEEISHYQRTSRHCYHRVHCEEYFTGKFIDVR